MASLGHGGYEGPREHPGRNEEEAAQDRLAVQVRSQDWQQPCQSHQHTGKQPGQGLSRTEGTGTGFQRQWVG